MGNIPLGIESPSRVPKTNETRKAWALGVRGLTELYPNSARSLTELRAKRRTPLKPGNFGEQFFVYPPYSRLPELARV